MDDAAEFSHLVGQIYDASLGPEQWPTVLERVGSYLRVTAVNLFSQDALKKSANVFHVQGIEPSYIQSYLDQYIKLNPVFPTALFFDVGRIITDDDVLPRSQLYETRFFKEWVIPQGFVDSLATILEKSAVSCAVFSVLRHQRDGLVDEDMRRRMELIVPHIRRSILIGKVIDLHKVDAAALADTLDGFAAGMFLVDANARILHANAMGHTLLADGRVIRPEGPRLGAADSKAEGALRQAVVAAESGDVAIGAHGLAIALSGPEGRRYLAHVLPLTAGTRRQAGAQYSAVAAVFVQEATVHASTPFEAIAEHFRLTPAELRVLCAIVTVGGVPETAPVLGISEATVKTHLQHVFVKTGTKRQADLVKMVAGYMSPFAQ
jgi:DNA-binding CsgD family transcriptional regulator